MAKAILSPEALAYFRRQGARGGKLGGSLGGLTAAARMSAKARRERARKAGLAAAAVRRANAKVRTP